MLDVPPVRYTKGGDAHIAYQVVGDGPVDLLVAPGFISHLDLQWTMPTFASYIEHLTAFSRVILFDKRCTGLSDGTNDGARFEQRVEDIDAVLDAAGSTSAVLLGMSEGGPLAAMYAATRPHRVQSLILLGTFAAGRSIDPDVLARFDHAVDNWGDGYTSEIFLSPESQRLLARSYFGLFERASCSPGMARALLESIKQVDATPVLPSLGMPVMLLHRRDDPFAATTWTDELEHLVPAANRLELDGADHLPWMGDSASIAQAVEEFVTGERADASSSRLVASVLFTDIVDSTRHALALGDAEWRKVLMKHNDLVRSLLFEYQGQEIKQTGDGFLGLFSTPGRAVRCAEAIVAAVPDLGLQVRAGVHSGEIEILDAADVAGITVHVAARVGAQAGPGQVLVSRTVIDLLVGDNLAFEPLGSHRLKGLPDKVGLYALSGRGQPLEVAGARVARGTDRLAIGALQAMATARRSFRRIAPHIA